MKRMVLTSTGMAKAPIGATEVTVPTLAGTIDPPHNECQHHPFLGHLLGPLLVHLKIPDTQQKQLHRRGQGALTS